MFQVDGATIQITRGDIGTVWVSATNPNGESYSFQKGDIVRFKVMQKKRCDVVVLQKDITVERESASVDILLTSQETRIGSIINKPIDYWYDKKDYLPGKSVYYWNDNFEHTDDLGTIMTGSYYIGLVIGSTDVEGMTLPIFIIKGSTERGMVNFTGLDSSGNIYKGVYNLMNMEVSSLEKVTLGGS